MKENQTLAGYFKAFHNMYSALHDDQLDVLAKCEIADQLKRIADRLESIDPNSIRI